MNLTCAICGAQVPPEISYSHRCNFPEVDESMLAPAYGPNSQDVATPEQGATEQLIDALQKFRDLTNNLRLANELEIQDAIRALVQHSIQSLLLVLEINQRK